MWAEKIAVFHSVLLWCKIAQKGERSAPLQSLISYLFLAHISLETRACRTLHLFYTIKALNGKFTILGGFQPPCTELAVLFMKFPIRDIEKSA